MAAILEKRNLCGLIIDCTLSESHSKTASITSEPISTGSNASDHMYSDSPDITLVGVINASPNCDYNSILRRPTVGIDNFPLLNEFNQNLNNSQISDILFGEGNIAGSPNEELSDEQIEKILLGGVDLDSLRPPTAEDLVADLGIRHFGSSASRFTRPEDRLRAAWCRIHEIMDNKEVCEVVTGLKVYKDVVIIRVSAEQSAENCESLQFSLTIKQVKRVSAVNVSISRIAATGKGVVDKGEIKTNCLRLNEVFQAGNAGVSAQIQNGDLVTSSFDRTVWESQVCGLIGARYASSIRNEVVNSGQIPLVIYAGVGGFSTNRVEIPNPAIELAIAEQFNQVKGQLRNNCAELLSGLDSQSSCEIPTACGDSRINNTNAENNGQSNNSANSSKTNVNTSSRRSGADTIIGLSEEILAEDPTSQYGYLNGGSALSNRDLVDRRDILFGTGVTVTEIEAQTSRLNCYYCEVLSNLSESPSQMGSRLRSIGFSSSSCGEIFSRNYRSSSIFSGNGGGFGAIP